jgi:hypothetical protein
MAEVVRDRCSIPVHLINNIVAAGWSLMISFPDSKLETSSMTVSFLMVQAMTTEIVRNGGASFGCTGDQTSMVRGCTLGCRWPGAAPIQSA